MWKTAIYNSTTKTFEYWNAKRNRLFLENITLKEARAIFFGNDCMAFYFEVAE